MIKKFRISYWVEWSWDKNKFKKIRIKYEMIKLSIFSTKLLREDNTSFNFNTFKQG